MKPSCWAQVQKGEANTANIMSACSDREVDSAQSMETFEKRNVALCQGSCAGELNTAKVCIDGKSLSYYFSRLN